MNTFLKRVDDFRSFVGSILAYLTDAEQFDEQKARKLFQKVKPDVDIEGQAFDGPHIETTNGPTYSYYSVFDNNGTEYYIYQDGIVFTLEEWESMRR